MENPVWTTAAFGEDVVLRVGDSTGTDKVSVRNYTNIEVASVNSLGKGSFNGTNHERQEYFCSAGIRLPHRTQLRKIMLIQQTLR